MCTRQWSMRSASVAVACFAKHDERHDRFSPFVVGHSNPPRPLRQRRAGRGEILHLDGGDVLTSGDDHVLLPVRYDGEGTLLTATVAGVEPASLSALVRTPRAAPSTRRRRGSSVREPHRPRRWPCARRPRGHQPAEQLRTRTGVQIVPLRGGTIDGEERRCLGEPVDLNELPPPARSPPVRRSSTAAARRPPRCAPCPGQAPCGRPRPEPPPHSRWRPPRRPHNIVTPWRSMRARISSPSTLRRTMWRPPMPVTA